MGVKLSRIGTTKTATLAVRPDGGLRLLEENEEPGPLEDTVRFTYAEGKLTANAEAAILGAAKDGQGYLQAMTDVLADLVTEWDVLDEEGEPLPVTKAVLREIGVEFVSTMWAAVFQGTVPSGEASSPSGNGSLRVAPGGNRPTGTS
jgi:hypothetical protein